MGEGQMRQNSTCLVQAVSADLRMNLWHPAGRTLDAPMLPHARILFAIPEREFIGATTAWMQGHVAWGCNASSCPWSSLPFHAIGYMPNAFPIPEHRFIGATFA